MSYIERAVGATKMELYPKGKVYNHGIHFYYSHGYLCFMKNSGNRMFHRYGREEKIE